MSEKNLKLWESVCETDSSMTKTYLEGEDSLTAINPTYRAKMATEKFGIYGAGWGVRDLHYYIITDEAGRPLQQTLDAMFWFMDDQVLRQFPVSSDIDFFKGKLIVQNQRKSLLTDVTGKALSKLGFNADVYLRKFDDPNYVEGQKQKHEVNLVVFNNAVLVKEKETIRAYLSAHETPEQVIENLLKKFKRIDKKTEAIIKTLTVDNLDETIRQIL